MDEWLVKNLAPCSDRDVTSLLFSNSLQAPNSLGLNESPSSTPCKFLMHIECIKCLCSASGGIMSKGGRFFASGAAL